MKIYYVIKCAETKKYLSYNDEWVGLPIYSCKKYDSEAQAIEEIVTLDGHFIIEKVYHI
jgi:hypothetical protein